MIKKLLFFTCLMCCFIISNVSANINNQINYDESGNNIVLYFSDYFISYLGVEANQNTLGVQMSDYGAPWYIYTIGDPGHNAKNFIYYFGRSYPAPNPTIISDGTVIAAQFNTITDGNQTDYINIQRTIGNLELSFPKYLSVNPTPCNVSQIYTAMLHGNYDSADIMSVEYYCYKLQSDNLTIDSTYSEDYTKYYRTSVPALGDTDYNFEKYANNGELTYGVVNASDIYEADFYPYLAGYYYLEATVGYDTDDDDVIDTTETYDAYQYVYGVYFTGTPTSGNTPLTVSFTDLSNFDNETVSSWVWEFGDGYSSYVQNPTHTYTSIGNFDVTLTVYTGSSGYAGTETDFITVTSANPDADFTGTPTSGNAPLTVSFTDLSNFDNETVSSWVWEFGDGYTSSAQNASHTYVSEGDYTVILTAYSSSGSDTETKPDYISVASEVVTGDGIIYGYTHDGTNLIDGVTVAISNSTWSSTNTSYGGGYYKFTGLLPGTYSVKGAKSGYIDSPEYSVTAYEGTSVEQDITLGADGFAVTGTCYNAATGSTLEGVTITFTQSGTSYTDTSDSSGEYVINDLSSGSAITVNAALSGYTYSSWSFTPEDDGVEEYDLYLIPSSVGSGTTIFGLVYNSNDEQAIEGATVTITNGTWTETNTTISTGFYMFDEIPAAGSYSLSAIAAGYSNSSTYSVTAVESSSVQQDIPLSTSTDSDIYSDYTPHLVRFLCVDEYNRPLQDVTISAGYRQSSGPVDWIYSILGISEDTGITSETLSGTTGIDGSIVFLMVETIKYDISVTASDLNLEKSFSIYPKEEEIVIRFYLNPKTNLDAMPDYELTATEFNTTHISLALSFHDVTTYTSNLIFTVEDYSTGEQIYSESFTNATLPGFFNASCNILNENGTMYQWGFEASNIEYGNISAYKGVTMKGATGRLVDFGLGDLGISDTDQDNIYIWLSVGFIFLFAGAFSGLNVKQGAVLVPLFGGGLCWFIGWLPLTHGAIISIVGFIGVLVYMRKSEWKVKI
ncbi:MAG: PKD domain-containing protein [Novosphingobium sp.]|nr:PKD domain-containing protein [Novosphingobium sp.]